MDNLSTYLSTKGQIVIPKPVRDAAGLKPGSLLQVTLEDGKIVLSPVRPSEAQALYGRFEGQDLLGDLARDRDSELRGEVTRETGRKQRNP